MILPFRNHFFWQTYYLQQITYRKENLEIARFSTRSTRMHSRFPLGITPMHTYIFHEKKMESPMCKSLLSLCLSNAPSLPIYSFLIYYHKATFFHLPRPSKHRVFCCNVGQIFRLAIAMIMATISALNTGHGCQDLGMIYSLYSRWTSPSIKPRLKHKKNRGTS